MNTPRAHVQQYVQSFGAGWLWLALPGTEGLSVTPDCQKPNPLRGKGFGTSRQSLTLIVKAEGKGFEPSTGCPAPDFESGC